MLRITIRQRPAGSIKKRTPRGCLECKALPSGSIHFVRPGLLPCGANSPDQVLTRWFPPGTHQQPDTCAQVDEVHALRKQSTKSTLIFFYGNADDEVVIVLSDGAGDHLSIKWAADVTRAEGRKTCDTPRLAISDEAREANKGHKIPG